MKEAIAHLIKILSPSIYKKILSIKQGRHRYTFSPDKYPGSFLNNNYPIESYTEMIPEVIYTFWTGDNEMSQNRQRGLKSMEQISEVNVILITPNNLKDYILEDFPLHKAYYNLTLNHRSDYLRCYFMHHFGGGYSDVKTHNNSWKKAFIKLNKDNNKWVLGYPEVGGVANVGGQLYKDLVFHISLLLGNGAFICRKKTRFTYEWQIELHKRMDEYSERLELFAKGEITDYPIPYTYLMGDIFHPLILKFYKKTMKDKSLMPEFTNYR